MEINSIIGPKITKALRYSCLIGGLGLGVCYLCNAMDKFDEQDAKAKIYIQNNDIKRYNQLINKDYFPKSFDWQDEAKNLESAIKKDSIAKTNYALGMQAVRNNLDVVNKK